MCALPVTIKSFLVLLLYFTEPIAPTRSVFENLRPHPWFFTKRLHPKRFVAVPRQPPRLDLPKIMYWKHLLELECIKELCQYHQDSLARKTPLEIMKQKQSSAFRNDQNNHRESQNRYKARENQLKPGPQGRWKHFGSENKIFWPPERIPTEKKSNVSIIKQEFRQSEPLKPPFGGPLRNHKSRINSKDTAIIGDNMKQNLPTRYGGSPEVVLNSEVIRKKESEPWEVRKDLSLPNLFRNSDIMGPSTVRGEDTQQSFKQSVNSDPILPYEVEEFFEENLQLDVDGNKGDSFKPFGAQKFYEEKAWEEEMTRTHVKAKNGEPKNVIDDSVNTILKRLMVNPVAKAVSPDLSDISGDELPLAKVEKEPSRSDIKSKPFGFKVFTGRPKDEISWNHRETYSEPKKVSTSQPSQIVNNGDQKSVKGTQSQKLLKPEGTRIDSSRGFDFTSNSKKESFRNSLTTDSPEVAEAFELPPFDIRNTQPELPRGSEKYIHLPGSETLNTLEVMKNLNADQKAPTDEGNPTVQSASDASTYPTTQSFIPDGDLLEESTARSTEDSGTMFTEVDSLLTTRDFVTTLKNFTESDVDEDEKTEDSSVEFTDHPESFDLFNTTVNSNSKKHQEATGKNSRKMNFEPETIKSSEEEQRRSDILISDNLADYADDENSLSTVGYIEKLKQNSSTESLTLTTEDLLPLIPVIINDLREGKISTEDYTILSRALGKYWNPILSLSNFTNLDMLPLLKMKTENDLNNVLQSVLPQNLTTPGAVNDDKVDDYYNPSYDYMDEYKELYKDILDQELGDKKRRFRPRRGAEDDMKTLEATREYFESIAEENSEGESDYFFEDIMYDEVSDIEDSSIFELMEVAGVHINKET